MVYGETGCWSLLRNPRTLKLEIYLFWVSESSKWRRRTWSLSTQSIRNTKVESFLTKALWLVALYRIWTALIHLWRKTSNVDYLVNIMFISSHNVAYITAHIFPHHFLISRAFNKTKILSLSSYILLFLGKIHSMKYKFLFLLKNIYPERVLFR